MEGDVEYAQFKVNEKCVYASYPRIHWTTPQGGTHVLTYFANVILC